MLNSIRFWNDLLELLILLGLIALLYTIGFSFIRAAYLRWDRSRIQIDCEHYWVMVLVYRRPMRRWFRKEICNPCARCGKLQPVKDVESEAL